MNHRPLVNDLILRNLSSLIEQRTGIVHGPEKDYLLYDKLEPLVMERGFDSFMDYYYYLIQGEEAEAEWRRVESVVTVNETYFWREVEQIKEAAFTLVPQLVSIKNDLPVRIWHAACGSGEEPYSMIMALMEANPLLAKKVEIIATDMSEKALTAARTGVYRSFSFRSLPLDMKQRYFLPESNGRMRLVDSIRNQVQFMRLNLVDEVEMGKMCNFDIIFCRNVFIYFSQPTIKKVVQSIYNSLNAPGYLFVSAVESLLRTTTLFDIVTIGDAYGYLKNGEV